MKISTSRVSWPIDGQFRISRGSRTVAEAILVEIQDGDHKGRGECVPYQRYSETLDSVEQEIHSAAAELGDTLNLDSINSQLNPGAARNALDCALWDLKAKQHGTSVAQLARLDQLSECVTAYTLSVDTPENMLLKTEQNADRPLLKLKLGGGSIDLARVEAVREGSPNATIIVDANEAWRLEDYLFLLPHLVEIGVAMIEQPFPSDNDAVLADIERPIKICADESCHTRAELERLSGRYNMINIKLDKTGGLTEAIALMREAKQQGFAIMVGCMLGSSLAMAPARLLAKYADIVDLDGPVLLAEDHPNAIEFKGSLMGLPHPELWG